MKTNARSKMGILMRSLFARADLGRRDESHEPSESLS